MLSVIAIMKKVNHCCEVPSKCAFFTNTFHKSANCWSLEIGSDYKFRVAIVVIGKLFELIIC